VAAYIDDLKHRNYTVCRRELEVREEQREGKSCPRGAAFLLVAGLTGLACRHQLRQAGVR
jgi:hypothetical protein